MVVFVGFFDGLSLRVGAIRQNLVHLLFRVQSVEEHCRILVSVKLFRLRNRTFETRQ